MPREYPVGHVLTGAELTGIAAAGFHRFASAAARNQAMPAASTAVGTLAYLTDSNTVTIADGSTWRTLGQYENPAKPINLVGAIPPREPTYADPEGVWPVDTVRWAMDRSRWPVPFSLSTPEAARYYATGQDHDHTTLRLDQTTTLTAVADTTVQVIAVAQGGSSPGGHNRARARRLYWTSDFNPLQRFFNETLITWGGGGGAGGVIATTLTMLAGQTLTVTMGANGQVQVEATTLSAVTATRGADGGQGIGEYDPDWDPNTDSTDEWPLYNYYSTNLPEGGNLGGLGGAAGNGDIAGTPYVGHPGGGPAPPPPTLYGATDAFAYLNNFAPLGWPQGLGNGNTPGSGGGGWAAEGAIPEGVNTQHNSQSWSQTEPFAPGDGGGGLSLPLPGGAVTVAAGGTGRFGYIRVDTHDGTTVTLTETETVAAVPGGGGHGNAAAAYIRVPPNSTDLVPWTISR